MLRAAILFLVISLIAAVFGFTTLAGAAFEGARLLFVVFLVLFIASLIAGIMRRGAPA